MNPRNPESFRQAPGSEREALAGVRFAVDPPLDDAALNALFTAAWPDHADRRFSAVLKQGLGYVAAFADDRLVGFVHVAWDGGVHAFLLDPTVHPGVQRRGIGRELVRRAASLSRGRGAEWLHVDFEPQLGAFYERCGFRNTPAGVLDLTRASEASPAAGPAASRQAR